MKKFKSENLPYVAAFGQALQFVHAGYILAGWMGGVIGAVIGATVNLSIAYASSRISDISKKRRWLSIIGLVALFLLSPAMVAPAAYLTFDKIQVQWIRILTALVWALAPDAAILLSGAIAGKSLMLTDKTPMQGTQLPARRGKKATKVARKRVQLPELITYLQQHPGDSDAVVAAHFGVSHQDINQRRKKITPEQLGLTTVYPSKSN